MEIETIIALKKHWDINGIVSSKTESDIRKILDAEKLTLPLDFIFFYQYLNGMIDQDEESFHFYKIEDLVGMGKRFGLSDNYPLKRIVIFADYMGESWWYGVEMKSNGRYEIGIISSSSNFKKISLSFDEFIQLYLIDSPLLYEYG